MNLVISKCVTAVKVSNFYDLYLRNRSTLDIGVLGYIGATLVGNPIYILFQHPYIEQLNFNISFKPIPYFRQYV
jgi:hypothetical protein